MWKRKKKKNSFIKGVRLKNMQKKLSGRKSMFNLQFINGKIMFSVEERTPPARSLSLQICAGIKIVYVK